MPRPTISQTLGKMQSTGTGSEAFEVVEQGGQQAEQLTRNLENVNLPDGFSIALYAIVPDARHMAVGPQGIATFVGTRKEKAWVITDRDKDRVADEVKRLAPSIPMAIPNGVCFSKDGFLFVVEQNRVLSLPAAEFFYESPDVAVAVVVPQGELVPPEEESFNHTARVCDIGPDNKLYISLGQPFNVPPPEKADLYNEVGIGGIIRMDRNGQNREVFARGIRNSVGQDFDPNTGDLWFTDNQVDGMGDDIPPGEINHATGAGQHFGFPWFGGGAIRTNEYKDSEPPADAVPPVVEYTAHAADLGMMFYSGSPVPGEIPRRHLPCPARLMEPHRAGRRARDVHADQRGWDGGRTGGVRRRLAHGIRRISRTAGGRGAASRRLASRFRRPGRGRLSDLLRAVSVSTRAAARVPRLSTWSEG